MSDMWVNRPSNYEDIEDFYRRLWAVKPWVFIKPSGFSPKGNQVMRQLYGDELDREVRRSADAMGWVMPVPRWDDDRVPF